MVPGGTVRSRWELSFYREIKKTFKSDSQNRLVKKHLFETSSFILMTLLKIFMQASLHDVDFQLFKRRPLHNSIAPECVFNLIFMYNYLGRLSGRSSFKTVLISS